jgi:hypothetical protein
MEPRTDNYGLSESELDAFIRALWGPPPSEWAEPIHGESSFYWTYDMSDFTTEQIWEHSGCLGQSMLIMMGDQPIGLFHSDEFAPLFEAINQMRNELGQEKTEAEGDWLACMADAGYPNIERREDAQNHIWSARDRIRSSPGGFRATAETSREMAALLEREIQTALADLDCRTAVDFQNRQDARRIEVETQFVSDHRLALEALRDAAEQRN